ncbi:MAG TPA: hypothetical protein DCX06_05640 [Opitutae bacterium]|nr:hypothetical protein [Opitutae bacterium]
MSAVDLLDVLRKYEGRWVGHFTIHSTATGYTETFPVEQQYWMEDEKLHGIAVLQRQTGMESSRSVTYILKDKLVSEITRGENIETAEKYWGLAHEDSVVWLPENMQRANDHQIKESIVIEGGEMLLTTEAFDSYVFKDGLAHIVFKGSLKFEK